MRKRVPSYLLLFFILMGSVGSCDILAPEKGGEGKDSEQEHWIENAELYFFTISEQDTLSIEKAKIEFADREYRTNREGIVTIDSIETGEYKVDIYTEADSAETSITLKDSLKYYEFEVEFGTTIIKDFQIIPYVILEGDTTRFSDLHSHYTAVKFRGEHYRYPYEKVDIDYIEEGWYKIWMKWLEFEETDSIYVDQPTGRVQFRSRFAVSLSLYVYDVVGTDTIPYDKGSIDLQIFENRKLNEDGKHTLDYIEKRESQVEVEHPNTEKFKRQLDINRNDSVLLKANPDYYTNFNVRLTTRARGQLHGVPNAEVAFMGNEYVTDENGEFRVDQKVSVGYYDLLVNSEFVSNRKLKIPVANRDPKIVELESETADYWPLEVGNQWTYKKTGYWEEAGIVTSLLNISEKWKIVEAIEGRQSTTFKVKVLQNGFRTEDGKFDTTWINDRIKHFKIVEHEGGTIELVDKTYLEIEESENINKLQPEILGDTVTFGEFLNDHSNARRLRKGVGLIKGQAGITQTTNSPWGVQFKLKDYNLQ